MPSRLSTSGFEILSWVGVPFSAGLWRARKRKERGENIRRFNNIQASLGRELSLEKGMATRKRRREAGGGNQERGHGFDSGVD
jgi:hypothetical protein